MHTNLSTFASDNPRIEELNAEIAETVGIRREAEQKLCQIESDTIVKNAELKNLEIELQTLNVTIKQLQHQRGEANKRLAELDVKSSRLVTVCEEQAERLQAEEERLHKVKHEISLSNENFKVGTCCC